MSNTHEKRNFGQSINDFDGAPLRIMTGVDPHSLQAVMAAIETLSEETKAPVMAAIDEHLSKPMTLGRMCAAALGGAYQDEKNLGEDERIRRFQLAMRVNKEGMAKITVPGERDLIKRCVLKRYQDSMVAAQICLLLEGKALEEGGDDLAGEP